MNKIVISFIVENKKFFHSKVPLITMTALLLVPFIGGFFMFILKDPELAQKMGVISVKAQIAGTADWSSYLSLLAQAISIGGLIVFGFVTSWIFGREYSDRTIKDLLALPISRSAIVLSKFVLVFLWCLFVSILIFALGLAVGNIVHMPGWSYEVVIRGFSGFINCTLLTILLSAPVAFFASIGRGYLPALGFTIFTLVLAQIVAATGYGQFFPWSIPAIASGVVRGEWEILSPISVLIVLLTSIAGLMSTIFWWRYADQN